MTALADGQTVRARGAGGVVWDIDVPAAGTHQRERFDQQIAKGELVIVNGDDGQLASEPEAAGDPLEAMTIKDLEAYAAAQDPPIDLGSAAKKADIIAVIKAAAGEG